MSKNQSCKGCESCTCGQENIAFVPALPDGFYISVSSDGAVGVSDADHRQEGTVLFSLRDWVAEDILSLKYGEVLTNGGWRVERDCGFTVISWVGKGPVPDLGVPPRVSVTTLSLEFSFMKLQRNKAYAS